MDSNAIYTSAVEFYNALQQCQSDENCLLSILPSTEHAETVIQLMVGGETQRYSNGVARESSS